jgi:crotonobetainyl-CoA:carnitine CoA-transferase CaiB-like acyl-CoA transferase
MGNHVNQRRKKSREQYMTDMPDFKALSGMSEEVRDELVATFEALSNWRHEIETVNERFLNKVLDRTSAVARAMGWPDQAVRTMHEYVERASKAQTQAINQMTEGWERQLKSTTIPLGVPSNFAQQMPELGSAFPHAKSEFNPLAPWMFWLQTAEMWRRTLIGAVPAGKDSHPH